MSVDDAAVSRGSSRLVHFRGIASLGLILVVGTAVVLLASPAAFTNPEKFLEVVRSLGATSFFLFVLIGLLRPMTLIPAGLYGIAAGIMFGTALGTVAAVLGQMGGALLAFYISRWLGREGVMTLVGSRLQKVNVGSGFMAVLFGRLIPIIPGDLVSYAAGVSGMRFRPYFWASLFGMILPVAAFAFFGDAATSGYGVALWSASILMLFLLGASLALRWFWPRRAQIRDRLRA